jgi:hypothetical protein
MGISVARQRAEAVVTYLKARTHVSATIRWISSFANKVNMVTTAN